MPSTVCEDHPDRAAVSRVKLRGALQRRCAACHDRDVRLEREEEREAFGEKQVEQLELFERAA